MVKPLRALLLLFYTGCFSALVMVLSPGEVRLSDTWSFQVFSLDNLWADTEGNKVDLSEINRLQNQLDSIARTQEGIAKALPENMDDPDKNPQAERYEPVSDTRHPIVFADSARPHQLDKFFASLQKLSEKSDLIRIVHYGDSQIEGDRITDYLRNRFQRKFGGCGVGLVPMLERQASRSTISTDFTPNWTKYAVYGSDNKSSKSGVYGLLCSSFRFSPASNGDSTRTDTQTYRAWVRFKETRYSNENKSATQIENLKFIYSSARSNIATDIKIDDDTLIHTQLINRNAPGIYSLKVPAQFKKLTINFESTAGAEFYGVALDCDQGVAVDNVALRGSSGVEFVKMDKEALQVQLKELKVKLIILQFGVNVVPNVLKDYTFYENMVYRQLKFFKSAAPDIDILVVGVSDMSRRQGTGYASYPNVPAIRDAQRHAAFRAGCAFWDLYEAMGGQNSMQSWVNNKPALAGKDYTHFNARGARLVGEMLYNALIKEYDNYKKRNKIEQ